MKKIVNGVSVGLTVQEETDHNNRITAINALYDSLAARQDAARQERRRRYLNETDELYLEFVFSDDPADKATWRAQVIQIKNDIPIPSS